MAELVYTPIIAFARTVFAAEFVGIDGQTDLGAFLASLDRPSTRHKINALLERGFHQAGDVENHARVGYKAWLLLTAR